MTGTEVKQIIIGGKCLITFWQELELLIKIGIQKPGTS
jgi:hypothetical protein